jgi:hypothetical protein
MLFFLLDNYFTHPATLVHYMYIVQLHKINRYGLHCEKIRLPVTADTAGKSRQVTT